MNVKSLVASGVVFAVAGSALAGMSPVGSSGEPSVHQIVQQVFGDVFSGSVGTSLTSTTLSSPVTLTRVDDFGLGGIMDGTGLTRGSADDQVWSGGVVNATVKARFAGYNQRFGYFAGTDAGAPYVNLFNVGSSGYSVTGEAVNIDLGALAGNWRWGRSGDGSTFSSRASDNVDGLDHMISFQITGLENGAASTWLLCFEDLRANQNPDWDYNDLVVEVSFSIPGPSTVGVMAGAGLLGVRRRRAR
ncbi:MAG: DUF4114 domain-containing protein [Planctomycetota bacterium]|nr:DUF4114 domain-containing protein [Planctomycetota bacterium]